MEILNRREQIGAKKLPPVIGDDVEKASKSKFGVVKIGDGINVSSGVISVPAGGITVEQLWSGTTSSSYVDISATLSAETLKSYKLILGVEGLNGGSIAVVSSSDGTYKFTLTKTVDLSVVESVVSIKNEGTGSLSGVAIYGIK